MVLSTKRTLCLLTFLCYVVSECKGQGFAPVPSCAKLDCPEYSVIHSQKEFEIRSYKDAQWVAGPTISLNSYRVAGPQGIKSLDDYFNGNNNAHVKMKETTPLICDVRNSKYTFFYYIPKQYQTNTPTPLGLAKDIRLVRIPTYKYVAVRRFGGFMTDEAISTQIAELKKSLQGTPYQRAVSVDLPTVGSYYAELRAEKRINEAFLWFD